MEKNKFKIVFLIYTYNRTDDAKINMEIIDNLWKKSKLFSDIKIVHSYNGEREWYPEKYLEDDLIRIKNSGHFQGATELVDAGIKLIKKKYKKFDFAIIVAADTWNIKPKYINNILDKINKNEFYWATCPWDMKGMNNNQKSEAVKNFSLNLRTIKENDMRKVGVATDFFILNLQLLKEYDMFPLNYKGFLKKYRDLLSYNGVNNIMFEKLIFSRYIDKLYKIKDNYAMRYGLSKIYILNDRGYIHSGVDKDGEWKRIMYSPRMGLIMHHNPEKKKKILKNMGIKGGNNLKKLLGNKNLSYYNNEIGSNWKKK